MARTRDLALPAEELTCREELAAPAGRPGLVLILPAAALFLLAAVCIAREAGAVRPLYTAAMLAGLLALALLVRVAKAGPRWVWLALLFAGAAALRAEYTLPNVSQTVIITRAAGRTPVPERESIRSLAAHQATMVLFLSTSLTEKLQGELLAGGYGETTPAAVVYKATWPEEKIFRCTVGTLHKTVTENGMKKTALIVVGGCLGGEYLRSLLYHPDFTTEYRKGKA